MREFKHHEQKLLKKVDFLNVSLRKTFRRHQVLHRAGQALTSSGSRMRRYEKSR